MSAIKGGDIRQFKINNREFAVPSETAITSKISAFENEATSSGNGEVYVTQKRVPVGLTGVVVVCDASKKDFEFLQEVNDSANSVPVSVTLASGITYGGYLVIAGSLEYTSDNGHVTFDMPGKKWEQI